MAPVQLRLPSVIIVLVTLQMLRSRIKGNNKDQLSLTNPRDALHQGERAANK